MEYQTSSACIIGTRMRQGGSYLANKRHLAHNINHIIRCGLLLCIYDVIASSHMRLFLFPLFYSNAASRNEVAHPPARDIPSLVAHQPIHTQFLEVATCSFRLAPCPTVRAASIYVCTLASCLLLFLPFHSPIAVTLRSLYIYKHWCLFGTFTVHRICWSWLLANITTHYVVSSFLAEYWLQLLPVSAVFCVDCSSDATGIIHVIIE